MNLASVEVVVALVVVIVILVIAVAILAWKLRKTYQTARALASKGSAEDEEVDKELGEEEKALNWPESATLTIEEKTAATEKGQN